MVVKDTIVKELETLGGQYALGNRYRHPSVKHLITRSASGNNLFDLEQTAALLMNTLTFVEECGKKGSVILFVSTRKETEDLVEKVATELSLPVMLGRWIGGTLSNFGNIRSRVNRLESLRDDRENDKWSQHTKKERILLDRELRKLEARFAGIISLKQLPDVVFILDAKKNKDVAVEAAGARIPIVSLSNADVDADVCEHSIVTNINSRDNVEYILNLLKDAYMGGVKGGAQQ